MLNHIVIMGRLARDPELKRTGSGVAYVKFSVAVERDIPDKNTGERAVDFIDCVAWRKTAEFISNYFTKGSMIVVSGRLQINKWVDNDGSTRYSSEISTENVYFGESKQKSKTKESTPTSTPYIAPTNAYSVYNDDDAVLPF